MKFFCRTFMVIAVVLLHAMRGYAQPAPEKDFPFWNYKLPLEQRVNDVVSRLTLEEKVAQMLNATPAMTATSVKVPS